MRAPSPCRPLLARAIVGRDPVLARLDAALEASATEGRVLAFVGEAGLGKTRLVRALVERAHERGRLVLEGRASPLEAAMPLRVIQDALRAERRADPFAPAPDDPLAAAFPGLLLPELSTGECTPEVDRGVLFEAAARYLLARSAPAGLVFVLEDLQQADPTSIALIGHLARTTCDAPILLALTYRPDEAPSGSSLDELRYELARERLGEEVCLEPLVAEDVALMLGDILGVDPDGEVLAMVARASGGNPFVVEELVRDAVAGSRLDPMEGRWRLEEPLDLPASVEEMVLRRMRALSDRDQELLCWAAVLGERFDLALLASVGGVSEQATIAAMRRMRRAGLVSDEPRGGDDQIALRHALTREAVLGELFAPDRRRRHARVLELAETWLPLEAVLEHALGAGDRGKSLTYSMQAAEVSVDLGGYQEARGHYERALSLWQAGDGLEMRAGLFMRLGYLATIGGGIGAILIDPRSGRHFEEARRLYEEIGDTTAEALATAGVVWSGQTLDVLDDLREARRRLGPDAPPEAVCQILVFLAEREFLVGHPRATLRTCAEGLALLEAPGGGDPTRFPRPDHLGRLFRLTSAAATWWLGDDAGARAAMLVLADEALACNDNLSAALACYEVCRLSLDRPSDAVHYAERGFDLAVGNAMSTMAAWLSEFCAQAHVHQGEWEAAAALLDRADSLLAAMPDQPFLRQAQRMVQGEFALGKGELGRALDLLEPLAPEVDAMCGRIFQRVVRVALARARLITGDPSGAHASLQPLVDRWEPDEEGPYMLSALLPMAAAEVASAVGDAGLAERWSGELSQLASGSRAAYARALTDLAGGAPCPPGAIESAAGAVERDGRRWEGAWMRINGATAAMRTCDADQAAPLAASALERFRVMEAEGWCRRCEGLLRKLGQRVPSRRSGQGPGGLTRRELEVLRLVAEGASNKGIAGCLFISKATAVRHVANIFAKLGVRNRAEATRVAADRGLLDTPRVDERQVPGGRGVNGGLTRATVLARTRRSTQEPEPRVVAGKREPGGTGLHSPGGI